MPKNIINIKVVMMDWAFDYEEGYGRFGNASEVLKMRELDYEGKKEYVKKLREEDSIKYYEWKSWCIRLNRLPDFFGTRDNPITIDESKL